jgi:RNA polymerase sigma factor (sigma-70 family)
MTGEEQLAAGFEAQRPYLRTLAFRVLGSHADAEDAVQEAWLRLARAGGAGIDDLRAWLTTVTGRICLDVLRSRRTRSEQPLELSLGLLTAKTTADPGVSPEDHVLLADSVGLALSVVMDALTPAERVSFVLHDVFEVPFDAIARILDRSTAATKIWPAALADGSGWARRRRRTRRPGRWWTRSSRRLAGETSRACSPYSRPRLSSGGAVLAAAW